VRAVMSLGASVTGSASVRLVWSVRSRALRLSG